MAHGAVCRFELPHMAENNRRVTRVDSGLWPQRTVPKLPSGTNGCQTLKTATLNTSYFCQKRPLCQPPPSPTPPPNSHFVRKVKLRLAYRLAFIKFHWKRTLRPCYNWRYSQPWTSISKQSGLYIRHIFIRHLWHPTPFTPDNFFTKHSLQQAPFTPNTL